MIKYGKVWDYFFYFKVWYYARSSKKNIVGNGYTPNCFKEFLFKNYFWN